MPVWQSGALSVALSGALSGALSNGLVARINYRLVAMRILGSVK